MATDAEIKALKEVTKRKEAYLKEFRRLGPKKAPTWGQWVRKQKQKELGGSRQMQEQLAGLRQSDFDATYKKSDIYKRDPKRYK
jgi:hypothetical protein